MFNLFIGCVVASLCITVWTEGWTEENAGTVAGSFLIFCLACLGELAWCSLAGVFAWPYLIAFAVSATVLYFLPAGKRQDW